MKLNVNTRYEILARAFNVMTGHMAPGKDAPAAFGGHDYGERETAWKQWHEQHRDLIRAMMTAFEEAMDE